MKYIGIILTIFVFVSCSAVSNEMSLKHKHKAEMSTADKAYISYIERVGRLMYLKNMRAARATDILLSKINLSNYPIFVGWVTYPNNEDFTVSFYELDGKKFNIVADVIKIKFRSNGSGFKGREKKFYSKMCFKSCLRFIRS